MSREQRKELASRGGLGATGRHLGQGRTADGREQRITAAEKAKLRGSGRDLPGRRVELEGVGI